MVSTPRHRRHHSRHDKEGSHTLPHTAHLTVSLNSPTQPAPDTDHGLRSYHVQRAHQCSSEASYQTPARSTPRAMHLPKNLRAKRRHMQHLPRTFPQPYRPRNPHQAPLLAHLRPKLHPKLAQPTLRTATRFLPHVPTTHPRTLKALRSLHQYHAPLSP
jgi:hypothetical protein